MALRVPKEFKPLVRAAQDEGFSLTRLRNGHLSLQHPDGRRSDIPSSPGDRKGVLNQRAALRKLGVCV